jgi:hypothetical protein
MRFLGRHLCIVAATSLVLAGCGGGEEDSASGTSNLPPIISGTPATTLSAGSAYNFTPSAADPDGDKLSFRAANVPTWATFDAATGALTGTPTESNVGTSGLIQIEVTDSKAWTQLPAFQISVTSNATTPPPANVAPTLTGTPAVTAIVGQLYTFAPVGDDANGDELTYTITNRPSWLTFTSATGAVSGTPTSANIGSTAPIVIMVSDGQATASLQFTITVSNEAPPANRAPTISGTPATSVTAGSAYSFRPVGSDPDGNSLSYSIQNRPSWASFSAATGRLSGTPGTADVGTSARITITVSDGSLTASLPSFTIQVNAPANRAPVISGTPATSAAVSTAYSFQPSASDADGNTLTFSIQNRPSWASFNTATGRLSGTPTAAGTFSNIVIAVSDGTAQASLPPFTITVNAQSNLPPVISGVPLPSIGVLLPYVFQPTASDPDGDTLTFSIDNRPPWATFNTSTGRLSGTPGLLDIALFEDITISVSDGTTTTSLPTFSLNVLQLAVGSATVNWTPPTENTDGSALSDLAGYRIAYGMSPTDLSQSIVIDNPGATSYTVGNLSVGRWYFAVFAVNSRGVESDMSNVANRDLD